MDGLLINNGNLKIKKDDKISVKSNFTTEIKINKKNIINYLSILKNTKSINEELNLNGRFENFLNITFDKTFKIIDYVYTNKGKINNSLFKFDESIKGSFLENDVNNLYLKDSNLNVRYASDEKNHIYSSGIYSIDKKSYQNQAFKFKHEFSIDNNFKSILNDIHILDWI